MKQWTYNKEIQILLEQFTSAFNDIVIKREDSSGNFPENGFKVNFVYAPKTRVFDILKNPAPGGLTLPAVAININSIQRDPTRNFNKNWGFNIETVNPSLTGTDFLRKIKHPVPVNIGVNMTILTKFQSDMDQIISNFVPYCDPYIIISWKLPIKNSKEYEIRTEILWSGSINVNYPTELSPTQLYRVTADTSFTIKGWLFKSQELNEDLKKIYVINSDFVPVLEEDIYSCKLITDLENYETSFVSISARPQLRWCSPLSLLTSRTEFPLSAAPIMEILGKKLSHTRAGYISASDPTAVDGVQQFFNIFASNSSLSADYPGFWGFPISKFTIYSDNYISFPFPYEISKNTLIDVIFENEAGYGSMIKDTTTVVKNISSDAYISPVCDGLNLFVG